MKKILSVILAVIMVFSMTAMVSARPVYDYDYFYPVDNDYYNHYVTDGYNFYDIFDSENRNAIEYLYAMGILQGYGNGYYSGNGVCDYPGCTEPVTSVTDPNAGIDTDMAL